MVEKDTTSLTGLSADNLLYLCQLVYKDSGIVLDESKRYLLDARLRPLTQPEGVDTIDQLCRLLQLNQRAPLRQKVVEAMTTNETSFFRDAPIYDALRKVILPEMFERRASTRRLSIWCAASSSGQEPYSLAILLREILPDPASWTVQILGTDISTAMVERCRRARYGQLEVNRGLPAVYLVKYFTRDHMEWELKADLRSQVRFELFNLKDSPRRLGSFDLVLCRNVMIYFEVDMKKQILAGIRQVLAPDGYLVLGSAETVYNLDDRFERRAIEQASFYRIK